MSKFPFPGVSGAPKSPAAGAKFAGFAKKAPVVEVVEDLTDVVSAENTVAPSAQKGAAMKKGPVQAALAQKSGGSLFSGLDLSDRGSSYNSLSAFGPGRTVVQVKEISESSTKAGPMLKVVGTVIESDIDGVTTGLEVDAAQFLSDFPSYFVRFATDLVAALKSNKEGETFEATSVTNDDLFEASREEQPYSGCFLGIEVRNRINKKEKALSINPKTGKPNRDYFFFAVGDPEE